MRWKNSGSDRAPRPQPIGNVRVTIDISDPSLTFVRFDLQKKILDDQWAEWRTLLVGDSTSPGVEGISSADREDPLTVIITVGTYYKAVGMAKMIARQATEALNLKMSSGFKITRPDKKKS